MRVKYNLLGRGFPAPSRLSNSPLAMLSVMRSSTNLSIWFLVVCFLMVFRSLVASLSSYWAVSFPTLCSYTDSAALKYQGLVTIEKQGMIVRGDF